MANHPRGSKIPSTPETPAAAGPNHPMAQPDHPTPSGAQAQGNAGTDGSGADSRRTGSEEPGIGRDAGAAQGTGTGQDAEAGRGSETGRSAEAGQEPVTGQSPGSDPGKEPTAGSDQGRGSATGGSPGLPPSKRKHWQNMTPLTRTPLFRWLMYALLSLLIVFIGAQVSFLFLPIAVLVSTLFLPVFLAGILFYLLVPVVNLLTRIRVPRTLAIVLVYLVLGGLFGIGILLAIPELRDQINSLIANTPRFIGQLQGILQQVETIEWLPVGLDVASIYEELPQRLNEFLSGLYENIGANLSAMLGLVSNIVVVVSTVPFVLFFMLKDGEKFPGYVSRIFPLQFRDEAQAIMGNMSKTLGVYIKGQMIVSGFVGVMLLLGYSIIGVRYALLLAVIALVTNLIPYIGPVIGTVPGLIVALLDSPSQMLKVLLLVVIVQQVESQLISPLVMGRQLKIHPVIIIFLLLTAGSMAGFVGLLLAVPAFAVARTAYEYLRDLYRLRKKSVDAMMDQISGVNQGPEDQS